MSDEVRQRLTRVFQHLFGADVAEEIVASASDTHEAWDSIAHINLVLAVEQDFRITFSPEEAGMTTSFQAILEVVEAKVGGSAP